MSFGDDTDLMESIEACRTCGIFFLTSSTFLRPLFTALDDPEMMHIRLELSSWNVEISENDGYPQFICTGCIHEFQKIFNFRKSCISIQQQFANFFYNTRTNNQTIQIKTEIPDENDNNFIYIDDLSDTEFDMPFNIPHESIKEELIEEAIISSESPTEHIDTTSTSLEGNILTDCNRKEIENVYQLSSAERGLQLEVASDTSKLLTEDFVEEGTDGRERQSTGNTIIYKCKYCNCISANKQLHRLHLKRVHEIKDLECHICGKTFQNSTLARLKFHFKWHRLNKHIKCVQCGFYCTSRGVLKDHVYQMHSKDTCAICGKIVLIKKMKCHMVKHGMETLFECSHCTRIFDNINDLNGHINLMHSKRNANVESSTSISAHISHKQSFALSKFEFSDQFELEIHMNKQLAEGGNNLTSINAIKDKILPSPDKHEFLMSLALNPAELNKPYCCKCSQEFMHSDELNEHLRKCQSIIGENYSVCNGTFEGFDYKSSSNYDQIDGNIIADYFEKLEPTHTDVYTTKNPINETANEMNTSSHTAFECAKCIYTFDNEEQLREHHDDIHSAKPNFYCDICGKGFELKFFLNRHLKKHK